MIGTRVGHYEIDAELGAGATAVVYRAHHVDPALADVIVAIKVPREFVPPEMARLLEQERAMLAKLRHANIVALLDVARMGDRVVLVTEYLHGRTLRDALKSDGPRSVPEVCGMAAQLLSALALAHARGVVHRDLKPDNVMLTAEGVKLLDFGVAGLLGGGHQTSSGIIVGTPMYLAPEIWDFERPTPATDVYALGVTLWEALAGVHPFYETSPDNLAAIRRAHKAGIPDVRSLVPSTPEWLADAIHLATERETAARYPSAVEMLRALRRRLPEDHEAFGRPVPASEEVTQDPDPAHAAALAGLAGLAAEVTPIRPLREPAPESEVPTADPEPVASPPEPSAPVAVPAAAPAPRRYGVMASSAAALVGLLVFALAGLGLIFAITMLKGR